MKIGFLKAGTEALASTRIRVDYVAKYIDNAITSNNVEDLTNCDAVIFQKRYKERDINFAEQLKQNNKIILFDLTDPVWDKNYPAVYFETTKNRKADFENMLQLSDCLILCTDRLREMFLENYKHSNIIVIPDRLDLEKHKKIKYHFDRNNYIILWHGSKFNLTNINLAREDIEKLGKEFSITLQIVCETGFTKLEPFNNVNVVYEDWNITTIDESIYNSDITINPQLTNSYKSNNKTVKSSAFGVPCIENDFYNKSKSFLTSVSFRNKEGRKQREWVEKFYDSKISAFELEDLINDIKIQRNNKENR